MVVCYTSPTITLQFNVQKGEARLVEPLGMMLSAVRAAILAGSPGMKCVNVASGGAPADAHQGLQNLDAAQARSWTPYRVSLTVLLQHCPHLPAGHRLACLQVLMHCRRFKAFSERLVHAFWTAVWKTGA